MSMPIGDVPNRVIERVSELGPEAGFEYALACLGYLAAGWPSLVEKAMDRLDANPPPDQDA
jgi:hypothetical protein